MERDIPRACRIFKNDGRFTSEQIAAALMCDLECNQHITRIKDENAKRRAIERLILTLPRHDPTEDDAFRRHPNWRERSTNGSPIPSMHNARLAITAIGVECSYDTFHDKLLFGHKDDTYATSSNPFSARCRTTASLGYASCCPTVSALTFTDKHVRDAVKSLALEHCFDPVADMLDEAEANWDGVKRLDRMAADYLNCEDTR